MRKLFGILTFLAMLLTGPGLSAKPGNDAVNEVIDSIFTHAARYRNVIAEYEAQLYARTHLSLVKSNFLMRYIPNINKLSRHTRQYLAESVSDIHFTAPDIYDTQVRYTCGNMPPLSGKIYSVKRLFSINVYSSKLLPNQLISPLTESGRRYYKYSMHRGLSGSYIIDIRPHYNSVQMVTGSIEVDSLDYSLRRLRFRGTVGFETFSLNITMGTGGAERFLPVSINGGIIFRCMRNRVEGTYSATLTYTHVVANTSMKRIRRYRKHSHDLTSMLSLNMSTTAMKRDFGIMDSLRPLPLTDAEKNIYKSIDTTRIVASDTARSSSFIEQIGKLGEFLINDYDILDSPQSGRLRFAPLLDIESLDYSHTNGVAYRTHGRYSRRTSRDRMLTISPKARYYFKRRELMASLNVRYMYLPQLRGAIYSDLSVGDRLYFSPKDIKIDDNSKDYYYKDASVSIMHAIEPVNGLEIEIGADYHYRYSDLGHYNSFAPRLILQWTPGLYYYMQGREKVNLRSPFPTFRVDMEKGISGIFNSASEYLRFEFEVLKNFTIGHNRLVGRTGMGLFTNNKSTHFIDYRNFNHKTMSEMYLSDIGGRYYLLNNSLYNVANKYVHAQGVFETPFLFFRNRSHRHVSIVRNERIYLSALLLQNQKPYIEYGYGISTHLLDVAIFSKLQDNRLGGFGFRISLELFRNRTKF
ncbi:MAG: hypothetical protein IKR18_07920 [Bacteroidaceae bacterium]|nr:hypothetical protein [Bacteroidaceae bacterium]